MSPGGLPSISAKEVPLMETTYDDVIVGGGSAGSVLGHRLSADGTRSVLVQEAGHSDYPWDLLIQMLAALTFPSGNPLYAGAIRPIQNRTYTAARSTTRTARRWGAPAPSTACTSKGRAVGRIHR